MRNQHISLFLIIGLVALAVVSITPVNPAQARVDAKKITITITEAQFTKYLNGVKGRGVTKMDADIVDGGVIVKFISRDNDGMEVWEHFGVLIRDGKIVTEAGVISFPDIGAGMGYEDVKNLIPELIPILDHNASILGRYVTRQVSAKAGTRYTPESTTLAEDKLVIVVNK